jgi:Membrane dipeptidase (Peptidase family M19)
MVKRTPIPQPQAANQQTAQHPTTSPLHCGAGWQPAGRLAIGLAFAFALISQAQTVRHHRTILIDTRTNITGRTVTGVDIGVPSTNHTDLPRMKKGGMGAQFFAVYVSSSYAEGNHSAKRALDTIDTVKHDIIEKYPGDCMFATTAGTSSPR